MPITRGPDFASIIKDQEYSLTFPVHTSEGVAVTELVKGDLTIILSDPTDTDRVALVTIVEIGSGYYKAKFSPDLVGFWTIIIIESTDMSDGFYEQFKCI